MNLAELTDDQLAAKPFDELVVELQRIVNALEAGSTGLEESIALYRDGLRLHTACERRLREAELTIAELGRRGLAGAEPDAADPAAQPAATAEASAALGSAEGSGSESPG
jgi:exodeoxyribonuclease VII small subunit